MGVDSAEYRVQPLEEKIQQHFGSLISIEKSSRKHDNILYNSTIGKEEVINKAQQYASSFEQKVTEAALIIRATVQELRKTARNIPTPLTPETITGGETEIPNVLLQFFRVLYTGSEKAPTNPRVERYVKSSAQDAIFATTRGIVKPAKHICLGLGLKSMTGSRKVVEIMNHFGHSINYHTIEELETELPTSITEKDRSTPQGMLTKPGLATGVAWDNYDENSETLSGAGTLHDTVGILYQNCVVDDSTVGENTSATNRLFKTTKKRKTKQNKSICLPDKIL